MLIIIADKNGIKYARTRQKGQELQMMNAILATSIYAG